MDLLRDLAGRTLMQKTTILVGLQSILNSQLIYFTYISEARTSAKYRNNLGELLTNRGDKLRHAKNYGARIKALVHSL